MTNLNNNITYKSSIRDKSSSSPKIRQYVTINENNSNNDKFTSTYKTNQKFSDYYPMFTPPISTLNQNQTQNVNLNVSRSNSCITSGTKSANSTLRQSQTFLKQQPVKANIRDTQWIKENILRNLKTRKPLAAAASLLNANSANSAATNESLGSTNSSYLLTPPSTVKQSTTESHAQTPPSALKMHPSSLFRHSNNGNQRSSEGTKKVEFVNLNDNNNTNLNSFQRLCELASRWNNKNRLVAHQVLKIREKKYLSNSNNNFGDGKSKIKKQKKSFKIERPELDEVEFNTPSTTTTTTNKSYTKVIAKNFIQLRPVNENVSFTNIHYAFSTSTNGPRTPPLHVPPLTTTPTLHQSAPQLPIPSTPDESSISPNSIKWINSSKNLIGNLQPLHVS
jgi:hypothetical protein